MATTPHRTPVTTGAKRNGRAQERDRKPQDLKAQPEKRARDKPRTKEAGFN